MKYRYVVVQLPGSGSWCLCGDPLRPMTEMKSDELTVLPELLAEGWVPVRETLIGVRKISIDEQLHVCLVLLSKED